MNDAVNLTASLITLTNALYWSVKMRQPLLALAADVVNGDLFTIAYAACLSDLW